MSNAITLVIVLRLGRYFRKDGLVFMSYLTLYSFGRIILTFVRQENVFFGGLQQAQLIAILVMSVSVLVMVYILTRPRLLKKASQE